MKSVSNPAAASNLGGSCSSSQYYQQRKKSNSKPKPVVCDLFGLHEQIMQSQNRRKTNCRNLQSSIQKQSRHAFTAENIPYSASSTDSAKDNQTLAMSNTLPLKSGTCTLENKLSSQLKQQPHMSRQKSDNVYKNMTSQLTSGSDFDHFISVVDLKNKKASDFAKKHGDPLGNGNSSKSSQITPQVGCRKSPKTGLKLTQTALVLSKNQFQPKTQKSVHSTQNSMNAF